MKSPVIFILILILVCLGMTVKSQTLESMNIDSLAKEYKALREQKKNQKPGEYCADLNAFKGKLHLIMDELGKRLGTPSCKEEDIKRKMGEPDTIWVEKQNPDIPLMPSEVHLIYLWRGWHDYLYFVSKEGVIQNSKWYFALE